MALDAEQFDFEGLGSKLTSTILDSFDDAMGKIKFTSINSSLTAAFKDVKMSKIIEDSLTKSSEVKATMKDIQKQLEDGFYKIKFKVGSIEMPEIPKQVVEVSTEQSGTFSTTPGAMTGVTEAMQPTVPTTYTNALDSAGGLVARLVQLTDQVKESTSITAEHYQEMYDIAKKLVDAGKLNKSELEKVAALQSKVSQPPPETTKQKGAYDINGLNMANQMANELTEKLLKHPEKVGLTRKQAEFLSTAFQNNSRYLAEQNSLSEDLATELEKMLGTDRENLRLHLQANKLMGDGFNTQVALNRQRREGIALARSNEEGAEDALFLMREQTDLFADQARALGEEGRLAEYVGRQLANGVDYTKIQQQETYKTLAGMQKMQTVTNNLVAAQVDYTVAVRQSRADIAIKEQTVKLNLTERETSELALQAYQRNLALEQMGLLTEEQKKQIAANGGLTDLDVERIQHQNHILKELREHVELVEHVAEYQLKINEEVEELSMSWKKVGATIKATLTNPTLAKGVIFASAIQGVHALTHSMHEFKDVGMGAGEAVSATMRSLSVASLLGLSKSADVTKTLAQQFGNLNTLTDDQIDSVGKLAASNGLAGEEATNLVMSMSRMPGMSRESAANSEKMFKEIGKTKGVIPAQIMKEMAKNSGLMATYSKGGAEGFAKAAASAKRMGVELSSVLNAAEKTLDFESSINAQMEASVLLGRELNMDKLRQATLSGDANAIMEEQQNLIKQAGGLENMNLLQKKKLAEAMGLTVEEMQKMNDEAQFQNEHFGEQAGLWSNITGYALKYGEAIMTGVQQFGPVIAAVISLASNMLMLNAIKATSTGATVADTGATVANTGAKVSNTGAVGANNMANAASVAAKNADTASITANTTATRLNEMQMKAYRAMRAASIPATQAMAAARAMETGAATANTTATAANASAGGFWNTVKGISNGIMNSSIVLWIREKASMVISTAAYYASAAAQGVWNTAKAAGNFLMSTSLGMWVAEKVNILASTVAKWANVGANTAVASSAGLAASATATSGAAATGASGGFLAFGAALGTFGTLAAPVVPVLLAIGGAILLATPALYVLGEVVKAIATVIGNVLMKAIEAIPTVIDAMAKGFVTVFQTLAANWPILLPLSVGLFAVGSALAFVGGAAMAVAPGLFAMTAVLAAAAAAMAATGFAVKMIAESFTQLTSIKTDTVIDFAKAIGILALTAAALGPAAGLMIIGAAGIAALAFALVPMSDALQKIAGIDTTSIKGFGLSLLSLSAAAAYIGVVSPLVAIGAGALILLSKAINPLSEAFAKLSTLKADNLLGLGKNIMGFAIATAYVGLMSVPILLGAAALYALGAALKPVAESFKLAMELKPDTILEFGKAVGGFAVMAAYLGVMSPLILAGAVSLGFLGLALAEVAKSFTMVQGLDIKTVEDFGVILAKFAISAAALAALAVPMMIGAAGIGALGIALIPVAKAFQMVSGLDANGIELFTSSLGKLSLVAAGLGTISLLMIAGATGIVILGKGLDLVAGAFQKVSGLDSKAIDNFGVALGKFSAIAAGLGILSVPILLGSYAILALGQGLGLVADTFIKVSKIDSKKLEEFGSSIGNFAIKAAMLAPLAIPIAISAAAIGALGMSLMPFANALAIAAPASEQMANVLERLATPETINSLALLSESLMTVAGALAKVGIAGLLALPALGALSLVAPVLGLGGAKVEGTAPEAKGIAPTAAPVPAPAAAPAATTTTTNTTAAAKTESNADIKGLMAKLDQLISVMQSGATITMDGKKVADIVQRNIRAVKFAD